MSKELEESIKSSPPQSGKRRLPIIWRLMLGFGLIGLLIWRSNVSQFTNTLHGIDSRWLLIGFIIQMSSVYAWVLRWKALLNAFEMNAALRRLAKALFLGFFFSSFLPTSFGVDFFRAYWVIDDKRLYPKSLFVAFVERFIGLVTLGYIIVLALLGLPARSLMLHGRLWLLGLGAVLLCGSAVLLRPRVFELFNSRMFGSINILMDTRTKVASALTALHEAGGARWLAYLYSFIIQMDGILLFYCMGRALLLPLEIWQYFFIVPPTVLATMLLPISFNGLGVREGMLILLTSLLKAPIVPAQAIALGVLVLGIGLTGPIIGGIVYFFNKSKIVRRAG